MWVKVKRKIKNSVFKLLFLHFAGFDFPSTLKRAIEAAQLSWGFCENCLSVLWRVFSQHDSCAASMGTLFFRATLVWRPFLGTLLGCCKRVPRPRCEYRNAK